MLEPRIQQHFFESADLSYQAAEAMARPIADAAQAIVDCVTAGGRIWVHGRGVAQAPALLLGAALSGRFERERPGLAAMVLAVDPLLLSEARASESAAPAVTQLRVLGQAGDVLVAFALRPDDALLAAGAVAGGLSLNDRRTSGTQIEDQAIELKSGGRIREAIGDKGHINVTSYNRVALVTGEVPADADKAAVEKAIAGIEGVTNVVNELEVGANSTISTRSSDTLITTRVKSGLVDAKDVQANAIKVVTERGNVYLMGRVSEREAVRATDIARSQPSVMKVVRVFEILTDEQLANLK